MTVDIISRKLATLASTNGGSALTAANRAMTTSAALTVFTNLANTAIDSSVDAIVTSGYAAASLGAASYVSDALATAQLAASFPHFCAVSADGRYWRAAVIDGLVPVWAGGAIGWNSTAAMDTTTNHQPVIAEALGHQQAVSAAGLAFDKAHYAIWTPRRTASDDNINTNQSGIPFVISVPCEFRANGFGNENINVAAPRFLIAGESATTLAGGAAGASDGRWNLAPSTTDTGFLSGLSIVNSRISCGSGMTSPFIQSNISNLRGMTWRNDKVDGGSHTYIVQFPATITTNYGNTNSDFEFNAADADNGIAPAALFANASFATLRDYAAFFPGDPNGVTVHPISDSPSLSVLAMGVSPSSRQSLSGATLVKVADATGGTDFHQVTVTGVGQGIGLSLGSGVPASGGPVFVELALRQAATHNVSRVQIKIFNTVSNAVALNRVVSLPAGNARFLTCVPMPASPNPANWVL